MTDSCALCATDKIKPCIKCGATERAKNGQCKSCKRATQAIVRKLNPEKFRARAKAFRASNLEIVKARYLAYRKANRAMLSAQSKAYAKANPEKIKIQKAAKYAANKDQAKADALAWARLNPEKRKLSSAKWYAKNPKKHRASVIAWNTANPDASRIFKQNRRAKEREVGGKISSGLAAKLYKLQRGKCACCGKPLGDNFHLDHRMPIALGGANEDWNMQLLTQRCNNQKWKKHPIDFMQSRGFLI